MSCAHVSQYNNPSRQPQTGILIRVGMIQEWSRIYFKVSCVLETFPEKQSWASKGPQTRCFNCCETFDVQCSSKAICWVTSLEINLVEYVHMDRTEHFGFRSNLVLICICSSKHNLFGNCHFWYYREHELIHWRYNLKSSPMLGTSRRGFWF